MTNATFSRLIFETCALTTIIGGVCLDKPLGLISIVAAVFVTGAVICLALDDAKVSKGG